MRKECPNTLKLIRMEAATWGGGAFVEGMVACVPP